ncbi:hypothetical protein MOO46_07315 (plasmid) [Apilactobacillus apisilvae]|uniref:Uncharacterized protein n=1 Tax=Apilactobacillus apisilvae TaxID=2923364 RepID=A0ABY4PJK2_9LACO|nr:hypothetical protein [Apilactobacillus apisilvae]UQS85793.1 hypothetical protein MOO46_07315 [Apilactobacillus apisilvae]
MPVDTQLGYKRLDYGDLLNDMKNLIIKYFGSDINLDDNSVLGMFANFRSK